MFRKWEEFNRCIKDQGGSSCNSILEPAPIERAPVETSKPKDSKPFKSPCSDTRKKYDKCVKSNYHLLSVLFCKYEFDAYKRCVNVYAQTQELYGISARFQKKS